MTTVQVSYQKMALKKKRAWGGMKITTWKKIPGTPKQVVWGRVEGLEKRLKKDKWAGGS